MTLHDAIEKILMRASDSMMASDIASQINKQNLYKRKDGVDVSSSQILARALHYKGAFIVEGDNCHLVILTKKEGTMML